jgi:ComF family protein
MSILPQPFTHRLKQAFERGGLAASCLLCGADSQHHLLCADCLTDLPAPPPAVCPQCAEQTTHGERCGACLKEAPHFDRTIAVFHYDFPVDRIIHTLKYGHQLAVAGWLGQQLAERTQGAGDIIMPLPLHALRLRERGFNQSMEIARRLGNCLNLRVDRNSLIRQRATQPQAGLALKERHANVRGAFECTADLSGQAILLIDDVMTSGATVNECARVLKLHGARQVTVAVAARALKQ